MPNPHSNRRRRWLSPLSWSVGLLVVVASCGPAEVARRQGRQCERSAQCESDHCELTASSGRVCCAIECVPGTVCTLDGSRCVTCDPALQSCGGLRADGERCASASECASDNCQPDAKLVDRCCEAGCRSLCDEIGRCLSAVATGTGGASTSTGGRGTALSGSGAASGAANPSAASGGSRAPSGGRSAGSGGTAPGGDTPDALETPACGDGRLDPGESCDNAGQNRDGVLGGCNTRCELTECSDGSTRACAEGGALGRCGDGTQRCLNGRWSACSITPAPEDSCAVAGDDADCDGTPNEQCPCIEGSEVACGPPTDRGACELGVSVCEDGSLSECRGAVHPLERDCASSDDLDCDGRPDHTIDEHCECVLGSTQRCDLHDSDGVGNCRAGVRTCVLAADRRGARWGECIGAVGPQPNDSCLLTGDDANCNGVPNDGCARDDPPDFLWAFERDIDGWGIRLTDPGRLRDQASLALEQVLGDPAPGSLRVSMPFDGSNQKIEVNVALEPPLDARGRVFRARVRLEAGLSADPNAPGGIKLFAKSGSDFVYVSGRWRYLTEPGEWLDVTLDPAAPDLSTGTFDVSAIRELGFELRTFSDTTQVSRATVVVDSVHF